MTTSLTLRNMEWAYRFHIAAPASATKVLENGSVAGSPGTSGRVYKTLENRRQRVFSPSSWSGLDGPTGENRPVLAGVAIPFDFPLGLSLAARLPTYPVVVDLSYPVIPPSLKSRLMYPKTFISNRLLCSTDLHTQKSERTPGLIYPPLFIFPLFCSSSGNHKSHIQTPLPL